MNDHNLSTQIKVYISIYNIVCDIWEDLPHKKWQNGFVLHSTQTFSSAILERITKASFISLSHETQTLMVQDRNRMVPFPDEISWQYALQYTNAPPTWNQNT